MVTEQGNMKTEVVFNNDSKTERYLLRKVWDESKPIVSLIMTNPSSANVVEIDMTTLYIISNLYKLNDYGGVDILNMTSLITTKIDTTSKLILSDENAEYILKSAETSDKVILAWGKIGENNKKIRLVQLKLLEKLQPFQDKLHMIESDAGDSGFHPLAPQIRFSWHLVPFTLPEYLQEKKDESKEDAVKETETSEASKEAVSDELQEGESSKTSTSTTRKPTATKGNSNKNTQTA